MVELLKQGQYQPLPVEKQITIIFAGTQGFVDAYPVESLGRYERDLYAFLERKRPDVLSTVRAKCTDKKALVVKTGQPASGEIAELLRAALTEFAKEFSPEMKGAAATGAAA
jgi:F-type H+-transporting ATPase subunit alpha